MIVAKWPGRVVGGRPLYHAVPTGYPSLRSFPRRVRRLWSHVPRRRAPEGPLHMERGRCSGQGLLASAPDSSPMAEHAFCRQSPAVGARALAGSRGSVWERLATGVPTATPSTDPRGKRGDVKTGFSWAARIRCTSAILLLHLCLILIASVPYVAKTLHVDKKIITVPSIVSLSV